MTSGLPNLLPITTKSRITLSQTPGLGRRVTELRERRGLLQRDLASRAGLSVSFLSEVENDHRTPGAEVLLRLADALGASLDYLLRGEDPRTEPTPLTIPPSLQEAAEQEHWSYTMTADLLRAQASVVAKRTPGSRGEHPIKQWIREDWLRLHEALFSQ
jgi:transcriptional regulator with XRE-family HTH domain